MAQSKPNWRDASYVLAGKLRLEVLLLLDDGPRTPKTLSDITQSQLSHISRTLRELKEVECVELVTPERRKAKIYEISEKGKVILEIIRDKVK